MLDTDTCSSTYSEQVNIRLRPTTKTALEQKARECGESLPDWTRRVLEEMVSFGPHYRLLMAEIMVNRSLLGELLIWSLKQTFEETSVDEVVSRFADQANAKKFTMADKRIVAFLQGTV